ncbi:MAG: ABC transporter ATP-binding protein [Burkholderiales bacterium]
MLIQFKNVLVRRNGLTALSGITLTLSERRIGVIGPNGAGKSTLARLVNGLVLPTEGQVLVDGIDTRGDLAAIRRNVGFVFQNPDNQIVFPEVAEDIAFGLKRREPDSAARDRRVAQSLESLGIGALASRLVHTLSGGERQLVALAGVLATRPGYLVMDEPTTQLDLRYRNRFAGILQALEPPALVASHDLELMRLMDRVIVIEAGRVAMDGNPDDALAWYRGHCG